MSYIINSFLILPTMLVLMIIADIMLISVSVVVYPTLLTISCTSFGQNLFDAYEEFQDKVFERLFGMSYMEAKGFKCQRTILMFQLESIPQLFFQGYLLVRLKQLHRDKDSAELGLSTAAIEFSMMCAFFHVIVEFIMLRVEAQTSGTPLQ